MRRTLLALALALPLACAAGAARAGSCEDLASLRFEDGEVVSAQGIRAGAFVPPGRPAAPTPYDVGVPRYDHLPAFCRVTAAFAGDLEVEVWIPAQGWNGEFAPVSGGIYGGRINKHAQLAGVLMTGAATATGNNGNNGGAGGVSGAAYLRDHPEKIAAIGDALHRMVVRSKQVIAAYAGRAPSFTYMSDRASRDPLLLIQRYPEDLDAVALTGPIASPTRHVIWQMWVHAATNRTPGAFLPPSAYPLLHEAVMARCDSLDGDRDGVLQNPLACDFDPGVLTCVGEARDDCLTAPQVEAVRKIYGPVQDARTGAVIFSGLPKGGELDWFELAGPKPYPFADQFYRNLAFRDPDWDPALRPVDFGADNDLANAASNLPLNADDPDIGRFLARGGKLLLLAGWNDQRITPNAAIAYYRAVLEKVGGPAAKGVRLFVVPGMMHYPLGGQRATDYALDATGLLRAWARTGRAPDSFTALRFVNGREDRARLICAFPKIAIRRRGSPADDAAGYACANS